MAFELSPAAQVKLAARKERYVASLKDKRAELERLASPILADDIQAATLEPLRDAVHKIAGSAGLYGFPELQSSASALDLALLKVGNLDDPVAPVFRRLIEKLFTAFDNA